MQQLLDHNSQLEFCAQRRMGVSLLMLHSVQAHDDTRHFGLLYRIRTHSAGFEDGNARSVP